MPPRTKKTRTLKAQVDAEFLTAHAVNIVMLFIGIGIIYWIGSASIKAQETCKFQTGVNCQEYALSTQGLFLKLWYAYGKPIQVMDVACTGIPIVKEGVVNFTRAGTGCHNSSLSIHIRNGQSGLISIPQYGIKCCDDKGIAISEKEAGKQYIGKLYVKYEQEGKTRVTIGDLVTTVERG